MGEESPINVLIGLAQAILRRFDDVFVPAQELRQKLTILETRWDDSEPGCGKHLEETEELRDRLLTIEKEMAIYRDRMEILSKVLWAFAIPLIGLVAKALVDLLSHKAGAPPTTSGSLVGFGTSGVMFWVARLLKI